jgi:acyl carrier protein
MWRIFKTSHGKVAQFRAGRSRQSDEQFVADCELPSNPEAVRIAIGVRRAVANVGLVDPLFIQASDRFPEELGVLPLWDSLDWVSLVLAMEEELGKPAPQPFQDRKQRREFSVKQLVQAAYRQLARDDDV